MEKMTLVKRTVNGDDSTMRFLFFEDAYAAMRYIFNESGQKDSVEVVGVLPDQISVDTKNDDGLDFVRWDIYDEEVMSYKDVMGQCT